MKYDDIAVACRNNIDLNEVSALTKTSLAGRRLCGCSRIFWVLSRKASMSD